MSDFIDEPQPTGDDDSQLQIVEASPIDPNFQRNQTRRMIFDIIETLLLAMILYFGIDAISSRVRVQNVSMQPTLYEGEFVLVSKISYWIGSPQVGDVIVFHAPSEPGEDFIKRIIGTPGDTVNVQDGKVFVNGNRLDEPYIADVPLYEGEWQVPADELFVLGDNRNQSSDLHRWGFVPEEDLVGKAVLIYWPFQKMALLDHPDIVKASQTPE